MLKIKICDYETHLSDMFNSKYLKSSHMWQYKGVTLQELWLYKGWLYGGLTVYLLLLILTKINNSYK